MPAPDIAVALVTVMAHWQNFKAHHRIDSPEYKCCEVTIEFFKSLDHLQRSLEDDVAEIADPLEALKELSTNRCHATTRPTEGRHIDHFCTLKAGHVEDHKWSDCIYCRKEERY